MTQQQAIDLFEYRDGVLYSKVKAGNNKRQAGRRVGGLDLTRGKGYYVTNINRKKYSIHRIVFLMHHGWLPEFIDHIDCNSQNNRIENLRAATRSQNSTNQKTSVRNTSGYKGVSWQKGNNKWKAQIKINGKKKHIGLFDNPLEAFYAYKYTALYHFKEFANV